ncbi:sigma-70 family RNA polymerase sigma factor [Mangrovivirga sp. M17]|uniref:Sigma-70 family RNA polymerase sigma factor n=1 Tax=Mangrovivirga halotolerans TaxID=2993936 RepID=A0ABT3RSS4_9BACT|nr:sigma-70 family RNA polymerase sigma factor [Mangrovivirga halotolerans]MCX2744403.1 sigma-70 family RNA polymerase sigma factor [Mangrovivirga halotolerans]
MLDNKKSVCEEKIFDSLFKKEARSLFSYLSYRFGDKEQANDAVQEAFVKLWEKCAEIPLEKAKGFLYTASTNLMTSVKRHEQVKLKYKEKAVKVDSGKSDVQSPEFLIIEKEYMDSLTQAINDLPERQRTAYLLNRVEKKTYKEIAEIMEVSTKAVEKLMHKALIKIKKILDEGVG